MKTKSISIRFAEDELRQLEAGAAGVGLALRPFMRGILLESLAVPSDKKAVLEAVLQLTYMVRELEKVRGLDERTIDRISARAQSISPALLGRFVMGRGVLGAGK